MNSLYDDSIKDLVADRCVKPVQEVPDVCNPLSVVCSRKGKLRLALDLCYANRYCSFKYEDLRTVLSMFNRGDYVITFDLKSGYHHVDINKEHWRYLGFYWKEQHYVFKVLPFGLRIYSLLRIHKTFTALSLFIGALKVRIRAVLYIDDGIVAFSALELAAGDPIAQVRDFEKGKIHIEEEKMAALIFSIDGLLASQQMVHVRTLASVVGQIVSMSRAIGYLVRLFTFVCNSVKEVYLELLCVFGCWSKG